MKGLKSNGTPIRVMAVDDSPVTRKLIKKALQPEGFTVVGEAGNGKEAVELYPRLKPDIITMDVTMPIMDGLQAASVIKKLDANQKILMLSAMSDNDIIAEAATYGIKHFCSKPFKPQQMVQKILEALEK
ncbi:MAG: response regulator [Syntrophomonadaceae bacterium]|nr:response regulator [Syntrophomonadaceae bacterium]